MKISEQAVDKPFFTLLVGLFLTVMGLLATFSYVQVELAPKIKVPFAFVVIPYPGAGPDEVENQISRKIDEKVQGLPDLDYFGTTASEGKSVTFLRFYDTADVDEALEELEKRVDQVERELPDGAEEPMVEEVSFDSFPIIMVNLTGDDIDLFTLKETAEDMKEVLEGLEGVEQVAVFGGLEREIRVRVDPHKLREYRLSFQSIAQSIQTQNMNMPGGTMQVGEYDYLVRTVGKFTSVDEIGETIVSSVGGHPLYLRDIAEIRDHHKKIQSYARFNGKTNVSLIIYGQDDADTIKTIDRVRNKVAELRLQAPPGMSLDFSQDNTVFIERMVGEMSRNAMIGLTLVVAILFVMMGLKNAVIVALAIPFSLLFASLCLLVTGMSFSNVAIFSFILVLGLVIDGAIIVGEAIYRHIEESGDSLEGSKTGIREVGMAVISADLTTVGAFLPMLFMVGVMGQFMAVLPKVVAFSLMGSVIADHFLLPVIASKYMKPAGGMKQVTAGAEDEEIDLSAGSSLGFVMRFLDWLRERYLNTLHWALQHRWAVVLIAFCAFVFAIMLSISGRGPLEKFPILVEYEFSPNVENGRMNVNFRLPPGTEIEKTVKMAAEIEKVFHDMPELVSYVTNVGDAGALISNDFQDRGQAGPEVGRIAVELKTARERKAAGLRTQAEIVEIIKAHIATIPGVILDIREMREGPPRQYPIAVHVYGDNLMDAYAVSQKIEENLRSIPGTEGIINDFAIGKPEVQVIVDREKAATLYGISAAQVANAVGTAYFGSEVTEITLGNEDIDIRVESAHAGELGFEQISDLTIMGTGGMQVPLRDIAEVKFTTGVREIRRWNGKRTVAVKSELGQKATAEKIIRKLQDKMKAEVLPRGVSVNYDAAVQDEARSLQSLADALIWGLLVILFVLAAQFGHLLQPAVVMTSIPLSLVGVILGLVITRQPLGFMSGIGVVALTGIVVNDAIVIVDYINMKRREGTALQDAVMAAGKVRFRPVLMTTITTIGGLLSLALDLGGGGEFWKPLAWSIIFGLGVASLLTLITVPIFYTILDDGINMLKKAARWSTDKVRDKTGRTEPATEPAYQRSMDSSYQGIDD